MSQPKPIWLNLWRARFSVLPFDVTVHVSEADAVSMVADDLEDHTRGYALTILIDPASDDQPQRLDLSDAAQDEVNARREEREHRAIESSMLRWRQAGV